MEEEDNEVQKEEDFTIARMMISMIVLIRFAVLFFKFSLEWTNTCVAFLVLGCIIYLTECH